MSAALVPYTPDLAPALIALWNRALGERFPLTERLWHQNVDNDPNARPGDGFVLRGEGGMPLGFALTRLYRHHDTNPDMATLRGIGWLTALAVDPVHTGRGHGTTLLRAAEAHLRAEGAERCDLGASPGHLLPGPPSDEPRALQFWERHGYPPVREVRDLARSLAGWSPPPAPPALATGGWAIIAGAPGEERAIVAALARDFPGRWQAAVADTFARGGRAEEIVTLRDPAGQIAGFLATWRPDGAILGPGLHWLPLLGPRPGAIGPLGIAETARGRGLGLALVAGAVSILRQRGVEGCTIDWVGTELLDFYARLGFTPTRAYWRCAQKTL
jgi:ribosomal protein S18 acetylase RimI-like enzyme